MIDTSWMQDYPVHSEMERGNDRHVMDAGLFCTIFRELGI